MHIGPFGQIGLCPLSDGEVNINLLLAPNTVSLLKQLSPCTLLRMALTTTPSLRSRISDVQLGPVLATGTLPHASRSVIADGVCLVGDAAGFCDPFSGEGMTLALCGAEIIAATLPPIHNNQTFPAASLQPYAQQFNQHIGRRHRLGRLLQYIVDRRRLSDFTSKFLRHQPLLAHALVADAAAYQRDL